MSRRTCWTNFRSSLLLYLKRQLDGEQGTWKHQSSTAFRCCWSAAPSSQGKASENKSSSEWAHIPSETRLNADDEFSFRNYLQYLYSFYAICRTWLKSHTRDVCTAIWLGKGWVTVFGGISVAFYSSGLSLGEWSDCFHQAFSIHDAERWVLRVTSLVMR